MDFDKAYEKLEQMKFDDIVKSYSNKVNDIKKLKKENKDLKAIVIGKLTPEQADEQRGLTVIVYG